MRIGIRWNRLIGLLPAMAVAAILAACTVQAGENVGPATLQETQQPAPIVKIDQSIAIPLGPGECGLMCDNGFWADAGIGEVRAELGHGADLTATDGDLGGTALHVAAAVGNNPDAITSLFLAGADISAVNTGLGATPLHMAAAANPNPAITALLLDLGADVESRTANGWTPLLLSMSMNPNPDVPGFAAGAGCRYDRRSSR